MAGSDATSLGDFFISHNRAASTSGAYELHHDRIPYFLASYADVILATGKYIHIVRQFFSKEGAGQSPETINLDDFCYNDNHSVRFVLLNHLNEMFNNNSLSINNSSDVLVEN